MSDLRMFSRHVLPGDDNLRTRLPAQDHGVSDGILPAIGEADEPATRGSPFGSGRPSFSRIRQPLRAHEFRVARPNRVHDPQLELAKADLVAMEQRTRVLPQADPVHHDFGIGQGPANRD